VSTEAHLQEIERHLQYIARLVADIRAERQEVVLLQSRDRFWTREMSVARGTCDLYMPVPMNMAELSNLFSKPIETFPGPPCYKRKRFEWRGERQGNKRIFEEV
jgi:hypothetical protein